MLRLIIITFLCFNVIGISFGQDYSWKYENSFSQKNIESWDVNPLGEIILYSARTIKKLTPELKLEFTQGNQSLGFISKIDANHSLKTLFFSENQQMLSFTDNTLTFQEGSLDLSKLGIDYALEVSYSDNPNHFWVFDEQNTRLIKFQGLKSTVQQSEISNLAGITNEVGISQLIEYNNELLLFYKGSGVFVFDYYGSLIRKFDNKNATQFYPFGKYFYFLEDNTLVRTNRETGRTISIDLPIQRVKSFRVLENQLLLVDKTGVHKYSLQDK